MKYFISRIFLVATVSLICEGLPNDEHPYLMWLQDHTGSKICGAATVDIDFVLVSATCLFDIGLNPYKAQQLNVLNADGEKRQIKNIYIHPNYDNKSLDNNLALLHIDSFNTENMGSMLTVLTSPTSEKECQIGGWENGQIVNVKVSKDNECTDSKNSLCVNSPHKCLGAGSILVCDHEIAGVGIKCGQTNSESIFADLSKHNTWIDEIFREVVHDKGVPEDKKDVKEKNDKENVNTRLAEKENKKDKSKNKTETDVEEMLSEMCQTCYYDCVEVWSKQVFDSVFKSRWHCKRGFYPYGCVYTVKHFILEKQEEEPYGWIPPLVYWVHNFLNYVKSPVIQKTWTYYVW